MEKIDELKTIITTEFKKLDDQRDADKKAATAMIKEVQDKLDAESKARLAVEKAFDDFRKEHEAARKRGIFSNPTVRPKGMLSEKAAGEFGAVFIRHLVMKGCIEGFVSDSKTRDALINDSKSILGLEQKTALTTSDFVLPVTYSGELRQLIAEYGIIRQSMTRFPIGGGSYKPPRTGTMDDFTFLTVSQSFPEKAANVTHADIASNKVGGIVRIPREIEEQSAVAVGQYLALHGASKFAKIEDQTGFLADGTATYDSISGVGKICDNSGTQTNTLAGGKTSPADAVLADFRQLQEMVQVAARMRGKYYLNHTWRSRLRTFKTQADPTAYDIEGGVSYLDGYPIVWTEVLQPYSTGAAASQYLGFFGDLTWYWFGEHGVPRIDTSADVFFATDEVAVRFIEEIDIDYNSALSMAALKTPAA